MGNPTWNRSVLAAPFYVVVDEVRKEGKLRLKRFGEIEQRFFLLFLAESRDYRKAIWKGNREKSSFILDWSRVWFQNLP
jgi:hypothetical protein